MELANRISKFILNHDEERVLRNVLRIATFNVINNKISNGRRIVAVMPTIYPHSGGETSALRIFNYMALNGYIVDICCYDNDNTEQMMQNSQINVPGFVPKFITWNEAKNSNYDYCIATNWISAFYAKLLSGYKLYFVQDYEPYFTEIGDQFCLAKKTYELGFHIISLGKWNIEQIRKNCDSSSKLDFIDFPFEPKEYPYRKRDFNIYSKKKKIRLVIYTRRVGRRIPVITQHLVAGLRTELAKSGIELEALFYGLNPKDKVFVGKNLGKINKSKLCSLYYNADFGMVASITNISLVPMEMHACGLPLIEFQDGSYPFFLGEDTAILTDYNYKTLASKIMHYLSDPNELKEMNDRARAKFEQCTWDNTCKQFADIMNSLNSGVTNETKQVY